MREGSATQKGRWKEIDAVVKVRWLDEVHRMERQLQKLRTRILQVPTQETLGQLRAVADRACDPRRRAVEADAEAWRRWFQQATAWCRLHFLTLEDAFGPTALEAYRRAAADAWTVAWEMWTDRFLHRIETMTADRVTEEAILLRNWRVWNEELRQVKELYGIQPRVPADWPKAAVHVRTWPEPPVALRLADHF